MMRRRFTMSETSPVQESMDINVIYLSIVGYSLIGDDELSQMVPPPQDAIFQKAKDSDRHMKPFYIRDISMTCLLIGEQLST
jgi:hypothetical protein